MPRIATQTATRLEAPVSAQAAIEATSQFTFALDLMAVVAWINSERDRDHVKEDPRKQLASKARLLVKATGICDVTSRTQRHLKLCKSVPQRLPKSYGKSAKGADRSLDDLLAKSEELPANRVG